MVAISSAVTAGGERAPAPTPTPAGAQEPAPAPVTPPALAFKPVVDLMIWTPIDTEASPEVTAQAQAFSDRIKSILADRGLDPQTRQARLQEVRQEAHRRQEVIDASGQAVTDHAFCAAWFRVERKRQSDLEAEIRATPVTPEAEAAAADYQKALDADAFAGLGLGAEEAQGLPRLADDPRWDRWLGDPAFVKASQAIAQDRAAARKAVSDFAQAAQAAAAPAPAAAPSDRLTRLEPRQQDLVYVLAHATRELQQTRTTADLYLKPKLADPAYRRDLATAYGQDMGRALTRLDQRDHDACLAHAQALLGDLTRQTGLTGADLVQADRAGGEVQKAFSLEQFGVRISVSQTWDQACVTTADGGELTYCLRNIGMDIPEALVGYGPPARGWRGLDAERWSAHGS